MAAPSDDGLLAVIYTPVAQKLTVAMNNFIGLDGLIRRTTHSGRLQAASQSRSSPIWSKGGVPILDCSILAGIGDSIKITMDSNS